MVLIKVAMTFAGMFRRVLRSLPFCSELAYIFLIMCCTMVVAFVLHISLHEFPDEEYMLQRRSLSEMVEESEEFIAPNDFLKKTAMGIKTYNRPKCLLELIETVRRYAPYLKIYVVDDSDEDAKASLTDEDHGDVYIEIPTDSGVGYGRNRMIEAIYKAGYKYLIMADDDYKLLDADTIPAMAKYMRDTDADVIAATRCDNTIENCQRSKGSIVFAQDQKSMIILPNITTYPPYPKAPNCYRSDLVQQFFMGKTEQLVKVHWDDNLKNNDHYDFLLSAKLANLKLVTCSDVNILHEKKCEFSTDHGISYQTQREQRWYYLLGYLFYKWNLDQIYDEVGKILTLNSTGHGISIMPNVTKFHIYSNDSKYLINQVVNAINSGRAAWTWLRPIFTSRTWVMSKTINPCTYLVSGNMVAEYDRYITFKNDQTQTIFHSYLYNESCFFAESLWRVKSVGQINIKTHVYYVTAVADDSNYLKRLFHMLNIDNDREYTTLIVVVMDSNSYDIIEANTKTVSLDIEIINQGPPFSRSIGLKVGFQKAIALAKSRGQENSIGFSIDTSITVPKDFSARVRRNTVCGVSAFVPIVFKCLSCVDGRYERQDGYWVNTGFGMVGLCLTDYVRIGGWSTVYGYRWGGEDVDIMERINEKIPNVIRTKEPNYTYIRSHNAKDKNPSYYMNKNLFPRPLPPSSETIFIDNANIKSRLIKFLREQVHGISKADLEVVQLTRTYTDNGHTLNYQVIVKTSQSEDNLLWFYVKSHLSPLV